MKLTSLLVILFATATLAKGPQPSNLSVTTNFASADSSGAVTDIQSDGLRAYYNGVDTISSILTTNGYNSQVWGAY